jgi:hypothetical protein
MIFIIIRIYVIYRKGVVTVASTLAFRLFALSAVAACVDAAGT